MANSAATCLPITERVVDRLADVLFATDDIVGMLGEEGATNLRWLTPQIGRMFDDVDDLMRKMSD